MKSVFRSQLQSCLEKYFRTHNFICIKTPSFVINVWKIRAEEGVTKKLNYFHTKCRVYLALISWLAFISAQSLLWRRRDCLESFLCEFVHKDFAREEEMQICNLLKTTPCCVVEVAYYFDEPSSWEEKKAYKYVNFCMRSMQLLKFLKWFLIDPEKQ